jgi:hypothetical protein
MIGFVFCNRPNRWRWLSFQAFAIAALAAVGGSAQAQPAGGQVSTPGSSIEQPGDTGVRAHTNIQIFVPKGGPAGGQAAPGSAAPGAAVPGSPPAPGPEGAAGIARPQ